MARGITVIDVMVAMGIEITNATSWSVGAIVRNMWEAEYGTRPQVGLRGKTNGGGSHDFAIYPESWRKKIEAVISAHRTEKRKQGDLFED